MTRWCWPTESPPRHWTCCEEWVVYAVPPMETRKRPPCSRLAYGSQIACNSLAVGLELLLPSTHDRGLTAAYRPLALAACPTELVPHPGRASVGCRTSDAQLLHARVERAGVEPQFARRAVRAFDLPGGRLADAEDVRPLARLQRVTFPGISAGVALRRGAREPWLGKPDPTGRLAAVSSFRETK